MRLYKAGYLLLFFTVVLGAFGCSTVQLKTGMTQEEVKEALGEPTGFHRRQIAPDDFREIWVYHMKEPNLLMRHLYPLIHLVVFRNGKMISTDPHDPYAPPDLLAQHN